MSVVRENLLKDHTYRPYCGADKCFHRWPRTVRTDELQYRCRCGWTSQFPAEFIEQYKETHNENL